MIRTTAGLYRGIDHSELAVVPGTSPFLIQEKPELCNRIIVEFLTAGPIAPVAPMRRAAPSQADRDENAKPS
jgi:hypothetical protein